MINQYPITKSTTAEETSYYPPASPNAYYEFYFQREFFPDLSVKFEGDWKPEEVNALKDSLLPQILKTRNKRDADISEWPYVYEICFRKGNNYSVSVEQKLFENPAAMFGGGLSGTVTYVYEFPPNPFINDIVPFIKDQLPVQLIREKSKLKKWQQGQGDSFGARCAQFLTWIVRR